MWKDVVDEFDTPSMLFGGNNPYYGALTRRAGSRLNLALRRPGIRDLVPERYYEYGIASDEIRAYLIDQFVECQPEALVKRPDRLVPPESPRSCSFSENNKWSISMRRASSDSFPNSSRDDRRVFREVIRVDGNPLVPASCGSPAG
ncbi:hypothetical protein [Streptomyces sp. NPDC059928]|uniref:hypothetical protein n=1 Tax=unclassified Streptomyces TaxID=2593676 RepID=UPI003663623F